MNFLTRVKYYFSRWMSGRYGQDELGMFTLMSALALTIVSGIFGWGFLSLLGFLLYIITICRMMSRKIDTRSRENRKYLEFYGKVSKSFRQFVLRCKNRKVYKYFRCPKCRVLLRLNRGCGDKFITCAKCGYQFHQKA